MTSSSKRLIYVKTPKTGGTSILSILKSHFPNHTHIAARHKNWPSYEDLLRSDLIIVGEAIAKTFRRKYTSIWHESRSFAVVRNPYEKTISAWQYISNLREHELELVLTKYLPSRSIFRKYESDYVKRNHDYIHLVAPQTCWITNSKDTLIVDDLLRFEHLQAYWNSFVSSSSHNLSSLPVLNRTYYKNKFSISPKSVKLMRARFASDFKLLGYPTTPTPYITSLIK